MTTPTTVQRPWFGREPALIIGTVQAILTAIVMFGLPGLSDGIAAALVAGMTAFAGFVTALYVRPIAPTIANGLIAAMVVLVAAFGVDVPQTWTGAAVLVVSSLVTLFTRSQVSPVKVIDGTAVVTIPVERSTDPIASKALAGR